MGKTILYFAISFVSDCLAYIYYDKYITSQRKDYLSLLITLFAAALTWIYIFKLQDQGQVLRTFMPVWAAGTAVVSYFIAGIATQSHVKDIFNIQAIISILLIGFGIYFLQKTSV